MGILDKRKVKKAISAVLSDPERKKLDTTQAVLTLKQYVELAIPAMFELLNSATPSKGILHLLVSFLDAETYPLYVDGLVHESPHVVNAVANVLATPGRIDPNLLLDLYEDSDVPRPVLGRILAAHKDKLKLGRLIRHLRSPAKDVRMSIFRLLDQVAAPGNIHEIVSLIKSDDPGVRLTVSHILRRFHTETVRDTLMSLLPDPNKQIRIAALEGLAEIKLPVDSEVLCRLLRDPDVTVQGKAIDALIARNDSKATAHLFDYLQDESEYVRRAAVEVLNEIGDVNSIKELMAALRDKDWWVRVRASDALGKIGGPKVVEAVLMLIKDEDEYIRRFAVEILNTTKDGRAFNYLVEATQDPDWWVRERAVDALAELGDKAAVPHLVEMLKNDKEARPVVIKALGDLGDDSVVPQIIDFMEEGDAAIRKQALIALTKLTGEENLDAVRAAVKHMEQTSDPEIKQVAIEAASTIMARLGDTTQMAMKGGRGLADQSMLQPDSVITNEDDTAELAVTSAGSAPQTTEGTGYIDASALKPGDVLDNRYEVKRCVGKGAFGSVILVNDQVVNEEIILKFLHPNLLTDKDMISRFVHEVRYARKITHENVIRIFDFVTVGKSYAMSMEYFESDSLGAILKKRQMSLSHVFKAVLDICKGMSVAHQANVVHRDLKPGNILINDLGVLKIVDFGLAAVASQADERLTKTGVVLGTPTYMAPEQVRDGEIDARTDIYSLGVVMYEMFTGRPPYQAKDPMAILFQHIEGKPTPPSELDSRVSPALEACILKAMSVESDARFQSMGELGREIQKIARQELANGAH